MLAGPAGGRMRARAPPRPSPHAPAPATGQGDPRRGPSLFSFAALGPSTPRRGSPVRDPRAQERMATRGTGGSTTPPAPKSEVLLQATSSPDLRANSRSSAWRGGGGQNRPAGGGRWRRSVRVPSGRPAVGCRWPRPSAQRRRGTARGPAAGRPARSHAQARRVGGRRSMRRPSDTAPAGQNERPHAVERADADAARRAKTAAPRRGDQPEARPRPSARQAK